MNLGVENEYQEFKESTSQLDKGLKSLTAMLNKNFKGSVYFGVKDNGEVIGQDIGRDTIKTINTRVKEIISPTIIVDIVELKTIDNLTYLKVSADGSDIPYSCDKRFYIRSHDIDQSIDNTMLRRMLMRSNSDLIKEIASPIQELTFDQMCINLSAKGINAIPQSSFYKSLELYTSENLFNINAFLMSDNNNLNFQVVEFEGLDKSVISKRTDYGHMCLIKSIEQIESYFHSINTTKSIVGGINRVDIPLFSFDAFHEALINASLHNSWNNLIPPSVFLYDDRIEIQSYGSLPYDLTLEDFNKGVSKPINSSLMRIFLRAKLAEQTGHGIPIILKNCGNDSIHINSGTIIVTIPLNYEREVVTNRKLSNNKKKILTSNQKAIIHYIEKHPDSSIKDISSHTNLSIPGVKKNLFNLRNYNFIIRVGSKRNGQWKVIK